VNALRRSSGQQTSSARIFVIFGNPLNVIKRYIKHYVRGIVLYKRILRRRVREALHQLLGVGTSLDLAFVGAEAFALEVVVSSSTYQVLNLNLTICNDSCKLVSMSGVVYFNNAVQH
jgi:hypothetical protein